VNPVELLRLPIHFSATDGTPLHPPMVRATVRGIQTLLVLDTGSDTHLLNKELADQIGLVAEPGETGTDHAGTEMPSWNLGTVAIELEGLTVDLTDVVAIPAPPPFPGWGVGGILSPQRLHPTAQVVVDMVHDELVLLHGDEASAHGWARGRVGDDRTILVQAAVSPHPPVPTLIDTGGRDTEFSEAAAPGAGRDKTQRLGGAVSGADVMGRRTGPAVLRVGDAALQVDDLAIRETQDPPGLIGMDVLRGTVVVCSDNPSGHVLWLVPQSRLEHGAPARR
jgi:hypothetical protein